jgi:hypothetical protein
MRRLLVLAGIVSLFALVPVAVIAHDFALRRNRK